MKRILALLLALLIPSCALAEAYRFSLIIDADEAAFLPLAEEVMPLLPKDVARDVDEWLPVVQRVLDGLRLSAAVQENAAALDVCLAEGKLADYTLYTTDEELTLMCSLCPKDALVFTKDAGFQFDVDTLRESVEASVKRFLADFEPQTEHGAFSDHAYDGGTMRTVWIFTDMDVAALLSAVLTKEVRSVASLVLQAAGFQAAELLAKVYAFIARVADEDEHMYFLHSVRNAAGEFAGLSLTVQDTISQVAEVSLGKKADSFKLVAGISAEEEYWFELSGILKKQSQTVSMTGRFRVWSAVPDTDFSDVSTSLPAIIDWRWRSDLTRQGGCDHWNGGIYADEMNSERLVGWNCVFHEDAGSFAGVLTLGSSQEKVPDVNQLLQDGPQILQPADNLQRHTLEELQNETAYQRLWTKASLALTARLFKLLPFDMVLKLSDLLLN